MSQSQLLVSALKLTLKTQNITYAQLGTRLQLSEATIKRMFATKQLSLARIDAICAVVGIEISDLLQKMQNMSQRISQLNFQQEQKIVSNRKLCLVTICVVNHWTFENILAYYNLTESECIQCLAELDSIKFIELLPKNKIKLLISPGFHWLVNGPIQHFFQQYIFSDFTKSNFQHENEEMICQFGMLTKESNIIFLKKLRHLAEEFLTLNTQDINQPFDTRMGTACVLMSRPWAPAIFNEFIK